MYDFYFGQKCDILRDESSEINYLLMVKRMMPRWCNSIPDSEYCAIYHDFINMDDMNTREGILIETGCGASTIMLAFLAFKYKRMLYTWDTNQNKLSYIRQILCDTHQRVFGVSLYEHWTHIGYFSNSKELGIGILGEIESAKNKGIDFAFFDSEHTSEVLKSEIELAIEFANDNSIFALDDANYDYKNKNVAYINVFRRKLGLASVERETDNVSDKFYELAYKIICSKYPHSIKNNDSYKKDYKKDIFWEYYSNDRSIMNSLGMEKLDELKHRYDSFTIKK